MEFHLGTSIFCETSTNDLCLHLVTNSTYKEELKVQIRNLRSWSRRFELKLNQTFFIRLAFD
jgi:hypothetical protein